MRVENEKARQFYLEECAKANWSRRQLERQINSFFYAWILFSKEKEPVRNEIFSLEKSVQAEDVIRDPYVLEFLGLEQSPSLFEKDIEQALILLVSIAAKPLAFMGTKPASFAAMLAISKRGFMAKKQNRSP